MPREWREFRQMVLGGEKAEGAACKDERRRSRRLEEAEGKMKKRRRRKRRRRVRVEEVLC